MASVETIIVGGGISAGSPFVLNAIPFISNITPPTLQSSPVMFEAAAPSNPGIVINIAGAVDPSPTATEVLRVRGGAIFEGVAAHQVVIGEGAQAAGNSPDMAIGFNARLTASGTVVGQNSSCGGNSQVFGSAATVGAAANGCLCVGGNVIAAGAQGCVVVGTGINIAAASLGAVVVGAGTLSGNCNNTTSINSGNVAARSACVLINNSAEATGNNQLRIGSAATPIILMVIGGEAAGAVKPALVFRTTDGFGADNGGRPLTIQPGMNTGVGTGGDVTLATGAQVGAGAVLQVSTPRMVVHGGTGLVEILAPTSGVSLLVTGRPNQAAMQINADAGAPGVMIDFNTTDTVGGGGAGTLTNAPHAGNPDAWLPVSLGGVKYRLPMWLA